MQSLSSVKKWKEVTLQGDEHTNTHPLGFSRWGRLVTFRRKSLDPFFYRNTYILIYECLHHCHSSIEEV